MAVDIAFWVLGVVAVLAGAAVFFVDSMARATYALALSFIAVGVQVLFLHQSYVGVVTILMMVMEMAIMAVFMIMFMMNPAGLMPMTMTHNQRGSLVAGTTTFVVLTAGVWLVDWPARGGSLPADATRQLGEAIMGSHMLVMLVIGIGLFATILAGTVLATARGRYDRFGAELDRREPSDPLPGGLPR